MTTNSATKLGLLVLGLVVLGLLAGACSNTHSDGDASSSGSHWLTCTVDHDCSAKVSGSHCGGEGVCVDKNGERVKDPAASSAGSGAEAGAGAGHGGSSGSGSGGSGHQGGAGGSDPHAGSGAAGSSHVGGTGGSGGSYQPCGGKHCGDTCTVCDPSDTACVETDVVKTCDGSGTCMAGTVACSADAGVGVALPECSSSSINASEGSACSARDDQPVPECCSNSAHLRCEYDACTNSIPASCHGTFQRVVGSTLCGGYQPCAGKSCGETCTICEPGDPACSETAEVKACDQSGACMGGTPDCTPPPSCNPEDVASCGTGQACCAVGRCGPLATDQGRCEDADPKTGGCKECACASQPGGCPICNSPETPIATPDGERAVADLREGDLVYSMDHGQLVAVPVLATGSMRVFNHAVARIVLDNGRTLEISGSHPTGDGRRLDSLEPGDSLGDVHVQSIELVPYEHERTYDILPASDSGTYIAGGALIGSTLFRAD